MRRLIVVSHHPRTQQGSLMSSLQVAWLSSRQGVADASREWIVEFVQLNDPAALKVFHEMCRDVRTPTLLLFNGLNALASWRSMAILVLNARWRRWPQIVYWHESAVIIRQFDGLESASRLARWWRRLRAWLIRRWIAGPRTTHWAVSRMVKQAVMLYIGVIPEHVTVVNEAIDVTRYTPGPRRTKRDEHRFRVCGIGDPTYRKGVDLFVFAANRFEKEAPGEYEFVWYGAGRDDISKWDLRWTRQDCLAAPVEWAGWTDDMPSVFQACDALYLSSRDDPFPIAALEALACDIPVFTLDTSGICEIMPSEFVARDMVHVEELIRAYRKRRYEYPPGFFRKLAEPFDAAPFRRLTEERLNIVLPEP